MWGIIMGGVTIFLTIIFSLAKASSHGEEITKKHRKELQNRVKKEPQKNQNLSVPHKLDEKKVDSNNNEMPPSRKN